MIEVSQLVELQTLDTQLQDLNELLGDLPKKVDKLHQEEESLINAVDKGKNRLKEIELALNKTKDR
jgi:predicted  nucleic acid-binding Zn-ribbon protein